MLVLFLVLKLLSKVVPKIFLKAIINLLNKRSILIFPKFIPLKEDYSEVLISIDAL